MLYTYSGTGLSIYLTDRMGRKALLLLSGFGMAAAMSLLVSLSVSNAVIVVYFNQRMHGQNTQQVIKKQD